MNRLVKLLLVIALTTSSYGAFAQEIQSLQTVIKESVHRYSVTEHTGNRYSWVVKKETTPGTWIDASVGDYSFVTSYTDPGVVTNVVDVIDLTEVFILWKEEGKYRVILREQNHIGDGDCFDAVENEKIQPVTVNANDFEVTIAAPVKTCAITGDNTVNFTVTKTKGKAANWKFKYQVSADGAAYGAETEYEVVYASDANEYTLPIVFDVPEGDDICNIKVKLLSATDGYNTPASNVSSSSPIEVTAELSRLAATSAITTD